MNFFNVTHLKNVLEKKLNKRKDFSSKIENWFAL